MALNALMQQMVNDTMILTKRKDLVEDTILAVKSATLKLHRAEFYIPDLFETGVSFDTALYQQELSIKELVLNYRNMYYIRKVVTDYMSPTGYKGGKFLTKIDPLLSQDDYGIDYTDVWYQAGFNIKINCTTQESNFLVGMWLNPIVAEEVYESWIAREVPQAIIYDAAATVFKAIGYDEQMAAMRNDTAVWVNELKPYIKADAY